MFIGNFNILSIFIFKRNNKRSDQNKVTVKTRYIYKQKG